MQDVRFGFQAAAAEMSGIPDEQLPRDVIADGQLCHRPGYDAASLAAPGTPLALRQKTRFAEEICRRHSGAMRKGRAA